MNLYYIIVILVIGWFVAFAIALYFATQLQEEQA